MAGALVQGSSRAPIGEIEVSGAFRLVPLPDGRFLLDLAVGGGGGGSRHGATHYGGADDALDLALLGGTVGVGHGGLGITTLPSGSLPYASALDIVAALAIGSAGKVLRSTGAAPAWSGWTAPNTFAAGSMPYASALDTLAALAAPGAASVLTHNTTAPAWVAALAKTNQHAQTAYLDGSPIFSTTPTVPNLLINAVSAATTRDVQWRTNGSVRWLARVSGAEVGSNAGSILVFQSRDDAGASAFDVLTLNRASHAAAFGAAVSVAGQVSSSLATGTAPFSVASTTLNANLNAELLGGQNSAYHLALANATGILATAKGGSGADGSALLASRFLASPSGGSGAAAYRALVSADLPADVALLSGAGRFTGAISGTGVAGVRMGRIGGLGGFYIDTGAGADGWSVFADSTDLHFEHDSGLALLLSADGLGGGSFGGMDYTVPNLGVKVAGTQVLGSRRTGWATATGTATRTTFDTATVTLVQLAQRVKALLDDLHATAGHGLIGT